MGVRKKLRANELKEARKNTYVAKLNGCPTSPRKMRLVIDLIRGKKAEEALRRRCCAQRSQRGAGAQHLGST